MAVTASFNRRRILAAHLLFLSTVVLHAADHIDRGTGDLPWAVFWGGILLAVFQFGSLLFTVPGHPKAPVVAMVVGFGTAVSTSLSHLAPQWSLISNPYPGQSLGAYSWAVMLAEIATGIVLGMVGLTALRRQPSPGLTR